MNPNPTQPMAGEQDRLILGLELVLTTAIFGFFGWLLDRWLGTAPWIMLGLGGFTFGYVVWRMVKGFDAQLDRAISTRRPLRRGPLDG